MKIMKFRSNHRIMKKCKNCQKKFEPKYKTTEKYCWVPECKTIEAMLIIDKAKKEKKAIWKDKKKKLKAELMTLSDWKKLLEVQFNRFIRQRDENCECISCDTWLKPGTFDAGHHWSKGGYPSVRFEEDNVFGQCHKCNRYWGGRPLEAKPKIIERIGIERYNRIDELKNQSRKYTAYEIQMLIDEYKQKLKRTKGI